MTAATTPSFDLAGKIVFITGASRGIGRACALACAGSGADMIVGVRKVEDGNGLLAEIDPSRGWLPLDIEHDRQSITQRSSAARSTAALPGAA